MLRKRAGAAENALMETYVSVIGDYVHPRQHANRKAFSKSDLEVLEWVAKTFGKMSAASVRKASHAEAPWLKSDDCCPIDYALFFEGRPEAEGVRELAEAEQESRDLLRPYVAR
jgi:hypothetical protein